METKKDEILSIFLLEIVLCLTIIQVIFLGIKQIAFHFMGEEFFSRSMITMVSMITGIGFLCEYKRKRGIEFDALPERFGKTYVFATLITILFFYGHLVSC